jgi:hypothetical protein
MVAKLTQSASLARPQIRFASQAERDANVLRTHPSPGTERVTPPEIRPVSKIPYKSALPKPPEYDIDLIMLPPRHDVSQNTPNPDAGTEIGIIVGVTVTFIFFVFLIPIICFCCCASRRGKNNMVKQTIAGLGALPAGTKTRPSTKPGYSRITPNVTSNKPGPYDDNAPMIPLAAYMGEGEGDGEYENSAYGGGGMGIVRMQTEVWERK